MFLFSSARRNNLYFSRYLNVSISETGARAETEGIAVALRCEAEEEVDEVLDRGANGMVVYNKS
jgi:hypothetical protein